MPRLFKGMEAEGIYQTQKTLFVEGDIAIDHIAQQLSQEKYDQVYFGAVYEGWRTQSLPSEVRSSTVRTVLKCYSKIACTIETLDLLTLRRFWFDANVRLIIPVVHPGLCFSAVVLDFLKDLDTVSTMIAKREDLPYDKTEIYPGKILERIQIKMFTGKRCYLTPLTSFIVNDIGDYSNDTLILGVPDDNSSLSRA